MRRHGLRFFFSLSLCAMWAAAAAGQSSAIQWQHDLEAAKTLARQTNRLVLVHFWTPECMPCAALEQNVFNQGGVGAALDPWFVPVKLNANENPATAEGLGITRVPTDVILTPDGQVVGRLISPPNPGAYIAEVTQVAREHRTRAGQMYAGMNASSSAIAPPVNAAYTGLQVAPATQPALGPMPLPTGAANGAPTNMPATTAPFVNNHFASMQSSPSASAPGSAVPGASGSPPTAAAPPSSTQNPFAPQASQIPASTNSFAPQANTFAPPPLAPSMPAAAAQSNSSIAAQQPASQPTVFAPAAAPITPVTPAESATAPAVPHFGAAANSVAVSAPDVSRLPAGAPPLGFEGYCPVSMRNHWKWLPGNPQWGVVHRGRTYWFVSQSEQQQFWTDPDRYAPALSGMDPVLAVDHQQQVPGKREHSIDYDSLFYMFSSEATLQQFTANPERYSVSVRQAMGIPRGRLVR